MALFNGRRLGRRRLLGLAGLSSAAAISAPMVERLTQRASAAPDSYPTRVHRWQSTPDKAPWESPVLRVPFDFNAVGVAWEGVGQLSVRSRSTGVWSDWLPVHHHPGDAPRKQSRLTYGDLIATGKAQELQYRVDSGQPMQVLCEIIDTSAGPTTAGTRSAATTAPRLLLRRDWGADERLRYDSSGEIWPVEFRPVQKIIIHHTATSNSDTDPAATVRAIYYYHAVTMDWGDMGYNFLVDPNGTVYEGRFGGPNAVGGHAQAFNEGSCGIAVLGSYGDRYISSFAESAMGSVVASNYGSIAPFGSSFFVDRTLANICGHRDCLSTECPGAFGYRQLPNLRDTIGRLEGRPRAQAQIVGAHFSGDTRPGGIVRVDIDVWNNSSQPIDTQGPDPGFVYQLSENSATIGQPGQFGAWRVGADFLDNQTGKIYPFRWGLGDRIEPGEQLTVTGFVELDRTVDSSWWAGLIQEGAAFRTDLYGVSKVGATPGAYRVAVPAALKQRTFPAG